MIVCCKNGLDKVLTNIKINVKLVVFVGTRLTIAFGKNLMLITAKNQKNSEKK